MFEKIRPSSSSRTEAWAALGLVLVLAFFCATSVIAYMNIQVLRSNNQQIMHTHRVIVGIDGLMTSMLDAETGQRGYLLTGNPSYLMPYERATEDLDERLKEISDLTKENPTQTAYLKQVRTHVSTRMAELETALQARRENGMQGAIERLTSNRGKGEMDAIRALVNQMQVEEQRVRQERIRQMEAAARTAIFSGVLSGLFGAFLTIVVFLLIRRSVRERARQEWLHQGQVGLANAMLGDQTPGATRSECSQFPDTLYWCPCRRTVQGRGQPLPSRGHDRRPRGWRRTHSLPPFRGPLGTGGR